MNSNQNPIGVTLIRHVDRISYLPDDVITNSIPSLLPTIDSVRTSALSTRWKHVYASVPVLDFQNIYIQLPGPIPSDSPFANFVSKELRLEYIVLRAETDDEAFRRLFSSCPVLERFSVGHWYMEDSRVLNMSVPPLKVSNVSLFGVKGELIINFPNLEMLRCESYPEVGFSGDVIGSEKVERLMKQVSKA